MKLYLSLMLVYPVLSHSYLTTPEARSKQSESQGGCRAPKCSPKTITCDAPKSQAGKLVPFNPVKRGDPVPLQWPRNNHPGGFIRIAWAKLEDSDTPSAFDKMVSFLTCHEMTCQSSQADPLGGDSNGPLTGCKAQASIPPQLTDGKWTMQWSWFGGGYDLADYYSCVDYDVKGGVAVSAAPMVPKGEFGDVHNKGKQQCLYFNTNSLAVCVNEPCGAQATQAGQHNGVPSYMSPGGTLSTKSVAGAPVEPAEAPVTSRLSNLPKAALPTPSQAATKSKNLKVKADSTSDNSETPVPVDIPSNSSKAVFPMDPKNPMMTRIFPRTNMSFPGDPYNAWYQQTGKNATNWSGEIHIFNGDKVTPSWRMGFMFLANEHIVKVFGCDPDADRKCYQTQAQTVKLTEEDGKQIVAGEALQPKQRFRVVLTGTYPSTAPK